MSFGAIWRNSDAAFWDQMWSKHKDSPMTSHMLDVAAAQSSICEIGCGYGHFLQALIDRGWRGRFVGFEMSPEGCARVRARCAKVGIEHSVVAGNFLEACADEGRQLPDCDLALCRGVVQHQAHWMPMTAAMLRIATIAAVGIGYVSGSGFHDGPRQATGHYDIKISREMMALEARAAGMSIQIKPYRNRARRCDEMLAIVERRR